MSTDTDLEEAYKMGNATSHIEGLRTVARAAVAGNYPLRVGPVAPKAFDLAPPPPVVPPKPLVGVKTTTTP